MRSERLRLEPELRNQLDVTRGHADTCDLSDVTRADRRIRQGEGRVIQRITRISAEVEFEALSEIERLQQLHIKILQGRSIYHVSSHIPERSGVGGREGIDVEPAINALPPGHRRRVSHNVRIPQIIR